MPEWQQFRGIFGGGDIGYLLLLLFVFKAEESLLQTQNLKEYFNIICIYKINYKTGARGTIKLSKGS